MQRRALLSTALGSSVVLSGCFGIGETRDGEGTTVEIVPTNKTSRRIALDVAVYATDSSLLLDHSYSLPAGHADESQGVENRVDYLVVSLDGGEGIRHEYDPDLNICSRDGEDVQIAVEPEGLRFTYSC